MMKQAYKLTKKKKGTKTINKEVARFYLIWHEQRPIK